MVRKARRTMSSSPFDAATDDEAGGGEGPATKKIKSSPPDVIVSVGSGENAQEFRCYKVILSFASSYFDTMLSSSMKEGLKGRIELPDKDPEEWKLFYTFISPETEVRDNAKIHRNNAIKLVPWFHEFQMNYLLRKCDGFLAAEYSPSDEASIDFWKKEEGDTEDVENKRRQKFSELLDVTKMASVYGLKSTMWASTECIAQLMDSLVDTGDLFDLPTVKTLLQMVSPIRLDGNYELKMSDEGCKAIWPPLERIISPHIANLSQDIVCDMSTFPLIVHSFMQAQIGKDRLTIEQEKVDSAKTIIEAMMTEIPDELYDQMPTSRNVDSLSRAKLKGIISEHYEEEKEHFSRLRIDPPSP